MRGAVLHQIDATNRWLLDRLTRDARSGTLELSAYMGETPENWLDQIQLLTFHVNITGFRAVRGVADLTERPIAILVFCGVGITVLTGVLIEVEFRTSMKAEGPMSIPLHPESRDCPSPIDI